MTYLKTQIAEGGPVLVAIAALSVMAWTLVCHCWLRSSWLLKQKETQIPDSTSELGYLKRYAGGLEQTLTVVAVMASVLPMLGLLGTVWGMLVTFEVIQQYGTGQPRLLARGIGQALLTTQAGLWAALPILGLHHILQSRVHRLQRDPDRHSATESQQFERPSEPVTFDPIAQDKRPCLSPYVPTQA